MLFDPCIPGFQKTVFSLLESEIAGFQKMISSDLEPAVPILVFR